MSTSAPSVGGDLAVIGIRVGVMEIPGAQHTAVEHHRAAEHQALLGTVVLVRRVNCARLRANQQGDEQSRPVYGQDPGADSGQSRVGPPGIGCPLRVARGLSRRGEDALAHVRGRFERRSTQCHRCRSVVQAGHLRSLVRRQRREASLEVRPLVGIERADRIGQDEILELVGDHTACSNRSRIVAKPVRMRVFTVPSGTPNRVASSL